MAAVIAGTGNKEPKVISPDRPAGCIERNTSQLVDQSALEARLAPRRNHFSQSPGTEVRSQCKHLSGPGGRQTPAPERARSKLLTHLLIREPLHPSSHSFLFFLPPLPHPFALLSFLLPRLASSLILADHPLYIQLADDPSIRGTRIDVYPSNSSESRNTVFRPSHVIPRQTRCFAYRHAADWIHFYADVCYRHFFYRT